MHVGTDFLRLQPVTGQYWSIFQCSMLGTGGTCVILLHAIDRPTANTKNFPLS